MIVSPNNARIAERFGSWRLPKQREQFGVIFLFTSAFPARVSPNNVAILGKPAGLPRFFNWLRNAPRSMSTVDSSESLIRVLGRT